MTKREAGEWVHKQLIVDEMDSAQLVAAFTVLVDRAPDATDRRAGLFRTCCGVVLMSVPAAPATHQPPPVSRQELRSARTAKSIAP